MCPVTRVDYSPWSGVPLAHADTMLRSLGPGVTEVSRAGAQAWVLSEDVDQLVAAQRSGSVRLLPAFYQYVVAASPHVQNLISADIAKTSFGHKAGFPRCCWSTSGFEGVWSLPAKRATRRLRASLVTRESGH